MDFEWHGPTSMLGAINLRRRGVRFGNRLVWLAQTIANEAAAADGRLVPCAGTATCRGTLRG